VAKDEKKVLDKDTNIVETKRKKSHSVTSNKKYELINVVSETGDSIYTPTITFASTSEVKQEGQFYINVDSLEILCDHIKSIQKGLALLRKDLVKAGVLKEV
jgi:hypothetical protein